MLRLRFKAADSGSYLWNLEANNNFINEGLNPEKQTNVP